MSSVHRYSPLHHLEESHDDDEDQVPHLIPFFPVYDPSPFTFSLRSPQRHPLIHHHHEDHDQSSPCGGSSDPLLFMVSLPTKEDREDEKVTARAQQQHSCDARKNGTVKWMSSKMRLMRKMMNSDAEAARKPSRRSVLPPQDDQQPIGIVRVCSDCSTTKTPLWRSGPQGPKSLCNACGIRQRKARKAMAVAAATVNAAEVRSPPRDHKGVPEEKCGDSGDDHRPIVPFKKRSKFATAGATEAKSFEEAAMGLGQNQHLPKVFPQDEKEAAILLMALSCGLVCR